MYQLGSLAARNNRCVLSRRTNCANETPGLQNPIRVENTAYYLEWRYKNDAGISHT